VRRDCSGLRTADRWPSDYHSAAVFHYHLRDDNTVIFTLLGFHFVSGLPAWRDRPYLPSANIDRFVVVVEGADGERAAKAEAIIKDAGAEQIQHVEEDQ
jgi:hypothetical protein